MNPSPLAPLEARALGVLIEKQRTVPDTYPLTLNALTAGCNQKTSRDPIMNDADVQAAIDRMKEDAWVLESSGGRVMRYAHNAERVLAIPAQSVALLAVLLLRGPQTVGELRINCDRLHRFADISAVEAFLRELAARPAGALVVELARAPGARETRWVQLLSGPPAEPIASAGQTALAGLSSDVAPDLVALREDNAAMREDTAALREDLAALKDEVEVLKQALAALRAERRV
jgi:uncharacterized protein YceH (UPF0502 family)